MKSIQSTTPGFVLTSMSFKTAENKKNIQPNNQQYSTSHKSSIAKFDYCLPPEENNTSTDAAMSLH